MLTKVGENSVPKGEEKAKKKEDRETVPFILGCPRPPESWGEGERAAGAEGIALHADEP